jgi:hypothetical protein
MEAKIKGRMAREIRSSLIFPIAQAMNRHTPTGGVVRPITKLSTRMTPKCSGSTPVWIINGSKTGVRIMREAVVSINVPTMSKKIFTSRRMRMRLWVTLRIAAVTDWGTSSRY